MEQKTEKNNLKLVALISALTIVILELTQYQPYL